MPCSACSAVEVLQEALSHSGIPFQEHTSYSTFHKKREVCAGLTGNKSSWHFSLACRAAELIGLDYWKLSSTYFYNDPHSNPYLALPLKCSQLWPMWNLLATCLNQKQNCNFLYTKLLAFFWGNYLQGFRKPSGSCLFPWTMAGFAGQIGLVWTTHLNWLREWNNPHLLPWGHLQHNIQWN